MNIKISINVQKLLKYVDKVEGYGVGQQVVINNQVNDNKLLETANKKIWAVVFFRPRTQRFLIDCNNITREFTSINFGLYHWKRIWRDCDCEGRICHSDTWSHAFTLDAKQPKCDVIDESQNVATDRSLLGVSNLHINKIVKCWWVSIFWANDEATTRKGCHSLHHVLCKRTFIQALETANRSLEQYFVYLIKAEDTKRLSSRNHIHIHKLSSRYHIHKKALEPIPHSHSKFVFWQKILDNWRREYPTEVKKKMLQAFSASIN